MNTIDYIAKGQKVQFSKKAVNINGKDYAYTGMTAIKHSSAKHLYLFKYEDSWRMLPYNPDDEQKLKVLFSRIAELNAKRAKILDAANAPVHVEPPQAPRIDVKSIMETTEEAPAEETQIELVEKVPEPVEEPAPEVVEEPAPEVIEEPTEIVEEPVPEVVEEPTEIIEEPAPEVVEEPVPEAAEEPVEVPEEAPAEPAEETPETPAEEALAEEAKETPAEETEEQAEGIFPPEEKKAKLKKSFKVLAAIIVAFIILAVVYFFVAGTTNNPTVGPNADETQQYEDIDGLIEDLQDDN